MANEGSKIDLWHCASFACVRHFKVRATQYYQQLLVGNVISMNKLKEKRKLILMEAKLQWNL